MDDRGGQDGGLYYDGFCNDFLWIVEGLKLGRCKFNVLKFIKFW
jgi:hypothetical protein